MKAAVAHINLLQRSETAHTMAWALVSLLAATVVGLSYYGSQVRSVAREAMHRRDDMALQLKQLQAQMALINGEQVKNADALALRNEVDALEPQARAAQALLDALRDTEGARSEGFGRTMAAMTRVNEPGLWLTTLTVSAGGRQLDVQGEARSGASVLRFARRANESLQPMALRLDTLEMQPAAAASAAAGAVSFHLH